MKKLLTLLFLALFAFTLAGCNKDDGKFKVDVFLYQASDPYIGSVRTAIENLLGDLDDVSFTIHDGQNQLENQNTQIDNAIARGTDLLVVNIVEPGAGQTVVNKAKDAKLPIIFFNREVDDSVINSYDQAVFVGTDPDEAGIMQGQMIADLLLENFEKYDLNDDNKISYVMLRANLDNAEANGRTKYSVVETNRILEEAGKAKLRQIGEDYNAEWDAAKAKEAMDTWLNSNPFNSDDPIELVIANNDDMALGAIQSLNTRGYNTGNDDKFIPVVGVDAIQTAVAAIAAGKMSGSIKQDADAMAACIVEFVKDIRDGNDYNANGTYEFENTVNKVRIPYAIYTGEEA